MTLNDQQGDSGGPLYDKENDKVVGVVSFGEGW
jgi:secreted trypsin-like serine protease